MVEEKEGVIKMPKKENSKKPTKINIKNEYSNDFRIVFANGVFGGSTSDLKLEMNFIRFRHLPPDSILEKLDEKGSIAGEIKREPENPILVREFQVGILTDLGFAKTLHSWLGKRIEILEKEIEAHK